MCRTRPLGEPVSFNVKFGVMGANYSNYTMLELLAARRSIDRDAYPQQFEEVCEAIRNRGRDDGRVREKARYVCPNCQVPLSKSTKKPGFAKEVAATFFGEAAFWAITAVVGMCMVFASLFVWLSVAIVGYGSAAYVLLRPQLCYRCPACDSEYREW